MFHHGNCKTGITVIIALVVMRNKVALSLISRILAGKSGACSKSARDFCKLWPCFADNNFFIVKNNYNEVFRLPIRPWHVAKSSIFSCKLRRVIWRSPCSISLLSVSSFISSSSSEDGEKMMFHFWYLLRVFLLTLFML